MIRTKEPRTLRAVILKKCIEYVSNAVFLGKNKVTKRLEEISYERLKEDTISLATALVKKYNLRGKKVIVIGENSYKWCVLYLAVTTSGGIVIPLAKELSANEIENLLNRSKAGCIIYSTKKQNVIFEIKKKVSKDIIYINMDKETSDESLCRLSEIVEMGKNYVAEEDVLYVDNENKMNFI